MIYATFDIRFDFLAAGGRLSLTLEAEVQEHHSQTYFVVNNFRVPGHPKGSILPPITVRKENGQWVHTDSGKETDLSNAVGRAIEARDCPAQ